MRRTVPSLVLAAVLAAVLAVCVSSAASAKPHPDHASVNDKAGDAPAAIDLVSANYRITKREARYRVKVRDLGETGLFAFEIWPLTDAWDRLAVHREGGRTVAKVYYIDASLEHSPDPVPHLVKCPELQVSWRTKSNEILVTWPIKCRIASKPYTRPFEFHVFSRLGSVHDATPARTLDF
jgi:hypothetical protein